jgi:hypothetical protein
MLKVSELKTRIRSIAKRNAKLRDDIQEVLINIAGHAYEHGDVTLASELLNVTTGQDKVAIVRWLRDYAFTIVKTDGSVKLNKAARNEADFVDGSAIVESLADSPKWYDTAVSTEKAAQVLDPAARIRALAKQISKGEREIKVDYSDLESAFEELRNAMMGGESLREAA